MTSAIIFAVVGKMDGLRPMPYPDGYVEFTPAPLTGDVVYIGNGNYVAWNADDIPASEDVSGWIKRWLDWQVRDTYDAFLAGRF